MRIAYLFILKTVLLKGVIKLAIPATTGFVVTPPIFGLALKLTMFGTWMRRVAGAL